MMQRAGGDWPAPEVNGRHSGQEREGARCKMKGASGASGASLPSSLWVAWHGMAWPPAKSADAAMAASAHHTTSSRETLCNVQAVLKPERQPITASVPPPKPQQLAQAAGISSVARSFVDRQGSWTQHSTSTSTARPAPTLQACKVALLAMVE
ncbi:hypothetical protein HBI56_156710 [Parastagonospora nodorum]|nr:hypothetical protein HBH53_070080 [Parastagonospora nodorum]KAH4185863.1 hypothetical protein HBH42_168940 [Parastagonospora nodorum]KAH5372203.1 hypothetical protein HBI33_169800 [Parastagonospora nodorum]KAH5599839.1 hypothetical protein HBI45_154600 [Parastagonospora nodorum]KAH5770337.1 hypothetical protein HBI16_130100 [Parastagonospora nodorum]